MLLKKTKKTNRLNWLRLSEVSVYSIALVGQRVGQESLTWCILSRLEAGWKDIGQPPWQMGDLLTQIQMELNRLHELFSCTVGELQSKAPAVMVGSVPDEEPPSASTYPVEERSKGFSKEVLATLENVEHLISKLPPQGKEVEQFARVTALQQEDAVLEQQLQQAITKAEAKLKQVQGMYSAMAQFALEAEARRGGGGGAAV